MDAAGQHVGASGWRLGQYGHLLGPHGDPCGLADRTRAVGFEGPVVRAELHAAVLRPRHAALEQVHVADEARDVAVGWSLINLTRSADLNDPPLAHHRDPVGDDHGLVLVVSDDHEGHAQRLLEVHELELGLFPQLLVEGGHGLVEQQDARPGRDGAGQGHPLPLAARQLVGATFSEALQLDQRQHLVDPVGDLGLRQALAAQAEGDVLGHAEMRKEGVGLEHHVDRPPVGRVGGDVTVAQQDAPCVRRLEARQHAHQRGLAAAGGPQQGEELTLVDREVRVAHSQGGAERLGDAVETHERLRAEVFPRREGVADAADLRADGNRTLAQRPVSTLVHWRFTSRSRS